MESYEKTFKKIEGENDTALSHRLHRIKNSDDLKNLISYVEGFHGADYRKISANTVAESGVPSKNAFLVKGYQQVIKSLAKDISSHLRLETPVKKISMKNQFVQILTPKENFYSHAVLITLPIGVLKSKKILNPFPKNLSKALKQIEMGSVCKTTFEMSEKFWQAYPWAEEGLIHSTRQKGVEVYWARPPFLISWMGGTKAKTLSKKSDKQIIAYQKRQLQADFGIQNLKAAVKAAHFHNWDKDKYSLGAYSYLKPGGDKALEILKEPLMKVVYFAGEALAPESGTVGGAIESGEVTAKKIINR